MLSRSNFIPLLKRKVSSCVHQSITEPYSEAGECSATDSHIFFLKDDVSYLPYVDLDETMTLKRI